jgi:hypothetical protein
MFFRFLLCITLASELRAQETGSGQPSVRGSEDQGPAPRVRKTIEQGGQTFELANSTANQTVETDEYVAAGEKIGDWTQLVTVQRLMLPKPTDSDAFVAYFKKRIGEDGATLDVMLQTKAASVFAVRFPKTERNDEQVMICLAFVDVAKPTFLNIVQYAIKPTRGAVATTTSRIQSWRDKFLAQARSMGEVNTDS